MSFRTLLTTAFAASAASSPLSLDSCSNSSAASICDSGTFYPTATIDTGVVAGTATSLPDSDVTVIKYLGIPFGERPVRFNPPEPARAWESIYDASEFKPSCMQMFQGTGEDRERRIRHFNTPPPPAGESEDCLFVNVYAPAGAEAGSKPVMFWVFGGSYHFGHGSYHLYDGSKFVALEDVVVVTFNYRTNLFGFPGSPDLPAGTQNPGLLDQRLALDWTRRNIAAFGGDPNRITLFGESAGGGSIDIMLTAPPNPIPFRAAIIQSNQDTIRTSPLNGSLTSWTQVTEAVGCDCDNSLECMRAVPAAKLKQTIEDMRLTWMPQMDGGVTVADNMRERRLTWEQNENSSLFAPVPVLVGTNADEGRFEFLQDVNLEWALSELATVGAGTLSDEIVELIYASYPIGSPRIEDDFDQVSVVVTEFLGLCPMRFYTDDTTSVGIDTWRYYFDASFPNSEIFEDSGAYHIAELEMMWGTYQEEDATEYQREVSQAMLSAWGQFARNPEAGPGWEQTPTVGVFGGGVRAGDDETPDEAFVTMEADVLDQRCALWYPAFSLEDSN